MLRSLTRHLQARQGGMGVVGVSPRYAERVAHKFSQFWRLPHRVVKVWDSHKLCLAGSFPSSPPRQVRSSSFTNV